MKRKLYYIIIRNKNGMTGGEYWREGKYVLGDWVKTKKEASKIPPRRADIYVKDWEKYGAQKILVSAPKKRKTK